MLRAGGKIETSRIGSRSNCHIRYDDYQVKDFMKSRNVEEDMAEDTNLWRLGVDGRLLDV